MIRRWHATEPVRLYLYGLLAPALGLLIVYGLLDAEQAAAWGLFGAALLVPGVELARRRVTPTGRGVAGARRGSRRAARAPGR